jgi:signal transduction histidine kinase
MPQKTFTGETLTPFIVGMPLELVLLVDHDHEFIRATKTLFKSKGYRVITALNEKKALEKILSDDPGIILLNLKMPEFSGQDLLNKIKKINTQMVVIVTDHNGDLPSFDDHKFRILESFSRPFKSHDLLVALEKADRLLSRDKESHSLQDSLLNRFFPFFAHEIRNPLQAIGGALTIIERRSQIKDPPLNQSIAIIKEEVQHLTGFVQECLDFVRPPNKRHWGTIDLNETIQHLINILTAMFTDRTETIIVSPCLSPGLSKVYANYEEIKKVIINILRNGFEALRNQLDGVLTIRTSNKIYQNKKGIEIIIQDNGAGIKKEDMAYIGTPFFTTKLRGTGLGLAICRRIIEERHNGRFSIASEEDKGTIVTIILPIYQEDGPQE